jgi:hypothetical protein
MLRRGPIWFELKAKTIFRSYSMLLVKLWGSASRKGPRARAVSFDEKCGLQNAASPFAFSRRRPSRRGVLFG